MSHELTFRGAVELADCIARGEVSSREVVQAHIARIEAVDGKLNAVVVRLFEEAKERAAAADDALQRGERWGCLHGVPVTVKESYFVAGTPSTMGLPRLAKEVITEDGILVRRLKRAGAIVLGKTNVPQLMLSHETDNPLYGCTNNPWDLTRTPGGSSGGEAAIIAAGGSPLGLASDLGGSIRLPSHFCGVQGIKATNGRLSQKGTRTNLRGMEAIQFQAGPIGRRVEDLAVAMRVFVGDGTDRTDWVLPPAPLHDPYEVVAQGLSVGYCEDDGLVLPSPAVRRAVREAMQVLRDLEVRVVPWEPPDAQTTLELYLGLMSADGGADAQRLTQRDPLDRTLRRLFRVAQLPPWLRWPTIRWFNYHRQYSQAKLLAATRPRSADEYWQLTFQLQAYVESFYRSLDAAQIDVLLCPPFGLCAFPHHRGGGLLPAATHCFLANLLGVPAGVTAVTRVRAEEESSRPASQEQTESFALFCERGSAGLPVGVQVIGRHWREDQVLAVMLALEGVLRTRTDYPDRPPL